MRWEGSEVVIWKKWREWGGIVGWHGRNNRRVVKWQGGRILVLFKGGERRVRPRYRHFVRDSNQQNEGA